MRAWIPAILLGAVAIPALAANFSGKWTMELSDRRGQTTQTAMILNHVGSEVTGSILSGVSASSSSPTDTKIRGGKVEGDAISFYVWIGRDKPVKRVFRGTMSGDEIRFSVTGSTVRFNVRGERLEPRGPQEATAKRTK